MYKCKECGSEYEDKPDYCDCGNDEFELVVPKREPAVEQKKEEQNIIKEDKKSEESPKPQAASSMKFKHDIPPQRKSFAEQYPGMSRMISSVDPISAVFFVFCVIFSLYIVFFAWNPVETSVEESKTEQNTALVKNIPSIDKFWNNTPPVYKPQETEQKTEKIEDIIKQVVQIPVVKKQEPAKTVQKPQAKVTKVPLTKVTQTTKPKTRVAKQTANTQTQTKKAAEEAAKKAAEKQKLAAEAAAKKKAEQERLAAEAAQLKKLQAEQAKKAEAERVKQQAAAKQEYVNYKAQLRNTIGRKIDFTRVIGDGSCTVAFKIDPNGKLINRSFAKQSSNNTLNDAVYAAVMATPSYNPPPSAYNNETLNLNIKFSNGNFEISLP